MPQLTLTWLFAALVIWQVPVAAQPIIAVQSTMKSRPCTPLSVAPQEKPRLRPTRIGLMDDRHHALAEVAVGWEKTRVPLVGFDGQQLVAAGCGDDIAMYYVVPMLARAARIALTDAVDLFLAGIVLISAIAGALGLILVCRVPFGRLVSIAAIVLLSLLALRTGDIYVVQSSVVLALVPWILFFGRNRRSRWQLLAFVFFGSAVLATANLFRTHAGTGVLIFMGWLVAFNPQHKRKFKLLLAFAALVGMLVPVVYFRILLDTRDAYLKKYGHVATAFRQHVFWHTIYVGLGYINNDVVPSYRDEVAQGRVREVAPQTIAYSLEYERYIKLEVMRTVRKHPFLVFETLAAKVGVIVGLVLVCANLGLVAAYRYPKHWPIEVAFWNAIAFQALFGILAIPVLPYLLGLIAFTVLYAVISIDVALQRGTLRDLSRLIRSRRPLRDVTDPNRRWRGLELSTQRSVPDHEKQQSCICSSGVAAEEESDNFCPYDKERLSMQTDPIHKSNPALWRPETDNCPGPDLSIKPK